jgi:thiol-disulfide isomerase/thioredoxin
VTDLALGPLTLPAAPLVACLAALLGLAIGGRTAARAGANIEGLLWLLIASGVLAARAAFVAHYWTFYSETPLRMLDVRDGGLHPIAGAGVALVLAAWLAWRHPRLRKALLAAVTATALAWSAGSALLALSGKPQQSLPELVLADMDGREVPLRSLAGQPLVVNLWASWCPPCRREMPVLARAQHVYPGVRFLFVNQGEGPAAIRAYLQGQKLRPDHILLDRTNRLGKATASPGMPTTLFFDGSGKLVVRRLGELSAATLAQAVEGIDGAARQPDGSR